jgi:hypothetical protein
MWLLRNAAKLTPKKLGFPVQARLFKSTARATFLEFKPFQHWKISKFNALSPMTTLKSRISFRKFTTNNNPEGETKAIVGYWYLVSAALVFSIVILGGVTRLTESGLSIVEWNLIRGMKAPSSEQEWIEEFEKYKQFPEFKLLNSGMNLEEFKKIFYFEWAHRNLGRFIGLSFVLPGLFFATRGYMSKAIKKRSFVIASLIGFQGLLGWLMVKSGLRDEILQNRSFYVYR